MSPLRCVPWRDDRNGRIFAGGLGDHTSLPLHDACPPVRLIYCHINGYTILLLVCPTFLIAARPENDTQFRPIRTIGPNS